MSHVAYFAQYPQELVVIKGLREIILLGNDYTRYVLTILCSCVNIEEKYVVIKLKSIRSG